MRYKWRAIMFKYAFLLGLINRRKQSFPVEQDRRSVSYEQANEILLQSIARLDESIQTALESRNYDRNTWRKE